MQMLKTFGVLFVLVAAVGASAWIFQRRLIYLPGPDPGMPPSGWETVEIAAADGLALRAWLGAPDRVVERSVAVIVFPGNAGTRRDRVSLGSRLTAAGFSVLLVDYRGYGGNPGSPDENGLHRDARAALAFVEGAGLGDDGIVYFGESLGSGVAVGLAAESPPDALVLRSPFTSLTDAAAHHFSWLPVRWLLRDRYPSLDRAGSISVPTLVIAGTADRTVPYDQSRRLAAALDAEFHAVEGADHNDPALVTDPSLMDAIFRFLETHTG
jgi:pimeloyl-ACP methyl ester carboxylesterase